MVTLKIPREDHYKYLQEIAEIIYEVNGKLSVGWKNTTIQYDRKKLSKLLDRWDVKMVCGASDQLTADYHFFYELIKAMANRW